MHEVRFTAALDALSDPAKTTVTRRSGSKATFMKGLSG
jgi:hypothetical protein